jgi:ankyrin repeat protein
LWLEENNKNRMSLESTPSDSSNKRENKTDELSFHNACLNGNLKVVKVYLARQGFDMNVLDSNGSTGFHLACLNGYLNVVQFLVQQGFDMNFRDNYGKAGFDWACRNGYLNVVQFLVQQGFDMNLRDDIGNTGFHWACYNGKLNAVQFLIQQGFDMNVDNYEGNTGFHLACYNGYLNVVQFFIQQGFDMNVVGISGSYGSVGFHLACVNENLNVIQFLIQQGFEGINERVGGLTGLKFLITKRQILSGDKLFMPCILLLIEAGAQLDENDVFEKLITSIQNRIIEITFMKETIFEKWTGRIAQAITDYTMAPFTKASLQNLSQFLD